ncbi:transposase [Mycetohabitans endofungorum]|nr:transposase [Mycetohabitans sp. B3]
MARTLPLKKTGSCRNIKIWHDATLTRRRLRRKEEPVHQGQVTFALRQAQSGTPVTEVRRKRGVSDAMFYNWRQEYGASEHRNCAA